MNHKRLFGTACAALLLSLLGACSGGVDEAPAPPAAVNVVPASAFADVAAMTGYVAKAAPTETAMALGVGDQVSPTSETAEPQPVD